MKDASRAIATAFSLWIASAVLADCTHAEHKWLVFVLVLIGGVFFFAGASVAAEARAKRQ